MTGNTFTLRLFIFQILELLAGIAFLVLGYPLLAIGCGVAIVVFTLPVRRAYAPDAKIEVNGEILTVLHGFQNQQSRMLWSIRLGTRCWCDLRKLEAQEAEFRQRIELDPLDPRGLYRWKR